MTTMRAAVLGSPIGHSLSPLLHNAAYEALGLDWTYEAIECDVPRLPGLLDSLDDSWAGLSLTMPLKRAVLPQLDDASDVATAVGGANTVVLQGGRRIGHNTDVTGMVDALREGGVPGPSSAVILGAGATACSTLAALREYGLAEVDVVARNPGRAADLLAAAERLRVRCAVHPWDALADLMPADLVVSTLPSGAADPLAPLVAGSPAVFDVVYAPWPTELAATAQRAGSLLVGGLALLLHQAARQVELMTGVTAAPIGAMRAAVQRIAFGKYWPQGIPKAQRVLLSLHADRVSVFRRRSCKAEVPSSHLVAR